jgi:hypothetical protein
MSTENYDTGAEFEQPNPRGRGGIESIIQEAEVPRPRRRFPTQTLLLLLILSASAGALYGMRKYGMQSGFSFKTVEVTLEDQDIERARTYERIMIDLARIQEPLDVALGEFDNSPFMRRPQPNRVNPDLGPIPSERPTDQERLMAEAVTRLKMMRLNSIIGPVARIDNQTIRAGSTIDIFTVKSVAGRTVTLEAYGQEFTISIETAHPRPSPGRQQFPGQP